MHKTNLTVIIPVHSVLDPNFRTLLDGALTSIANNQTKPEKVLIVRCPCSEVKSELDTMTLQYDGLDIEIIENTTGKSLQNQINFGVSQTKTKYFSFLEFDDEMSVKWLKNVDTYSKAYPEVKMFLPIISDVNADGVFTGYTNEAVWAKDFSEKIGVLDTETLLEFANINLSGMVVDVEAFKAVGGYKPSIKLYFNYELLLRFVDKGNTTMVIPKIGYKHVNMRPGSLFWNYRFDEDESQRLTSEEAHFWLDVAKREYFFTEDRQISYAANETL